MFKLNNKEFFNKKKISTLFFNNTFLEKKDILTYLIKNDFIKIEFFPYLNGKNKSDIFGKCLAIRKKHQNTTITIVYALNKYKIITTISLYNKFIKNIIIYKKN